MHFPIVLAFDADLKLYVSVWMQVYAIVVVLMFLCVLKQGQCLVSIDFVVIL